MKPIPQEFDVTYYRQNNLGLRRTLTTSLSKLFSKQRTPDPNWSDKELSSHFRDIGRYEGRAGSHCAFRENLIDLIDADDHALEIGPFTNPCLRGENVRYFDVLDAKQLLERAQSIQYPVNDPPPIDYVSPTGDLSVVESNSFDVVFSSHSIEHQPDLIKHLHDVERLLRPGGRYVLVIPDKQYIFDHFIPNSTLAGVLQAHQERRTTHTLQSVIEHRAMVTHNDGRLHWKGDHGAMRMATDMSWVQKAIDEFEAAKGAYIDVHAWQFTAHSFHTILQQLHTLGTTNLTVERTYNTPQGRIEFCAILRKET